MGLGRPGRLRYMAPPRGGGDALASTRDGGMARVLQQGCRCFTGPFGYDRASVGLVCSCRSVWSTIAERQRWRWVMSTHASILVDSDRPPSAEVCRTAASFP
jgi:hypothetical protein